MKNTRSGTWVIVSCVALAGGFFTSFGCTGSKILVGKEGSAINADYCYGVSTNCSAKANTIVGSDSTIQTCPEGTVGVLESDSIAPLGGESWTFDGAKFAPDGSFWVISDNQTELGPLPAIGPSNGTADVTNSTLPPSGLRLARYSTTLELIGFTDEVTLGTGFGAYAHDLAVDAAGNATFVVYSARAANADSPVEERVMLYAFDGALQPVGEPIALRGIAATQVSAGPTGTITLAGNAAQNAPHGVLARLKNGKPEWIQSNVPTTGQGASVGVSSLVVGEDGSAFVVAQRSPAWNGGSDIIKYSVTRFDASGNLHWDLLIPTEYLGGSLAEMVRGPRGGVIVTADLDFESSLVREISADGQLGWTYRFQMAASDVDAVSGRTLVLTRRWNAAASRYEAIVAAISKDGQNCQQYGLPTNSAGEVPGVGGIAVMSPYLYMPSDAGMLRFRLPSE